MLTVLQASINGSMTPSKSLPVSPKLTLGQEESFDCSTTRISPPPAPQRITSPLLLPTNLPGDAVIEEDDEEWNEEKSDSIGTDSVITRPNLNQQEQQDGSKGKTTTTRSGKITEFDYRLDDPGHPRRQQQTAVIKPISTLLVPNELSVFGPSSSMKPSHKIRQMMITREGGRGLGPNICLERKEKMVTARTFEQFHGRRRRQRQTTEGGPRTGTGTRDDDGCLKDTFSNDPKKDDTWTQFDSRDFHTRGW